MHSGTFIYLGGRPAPRGRHRPNHWGTPPRRGSWRCLCRCSSSSASRPSSVEPSSGLGFFSGKRSGNVKVCPWACGAGKRLQPAGACVAGGPPATWTGPPHPPPVCHPGRRGSTCLTHSEVLTLPTALLFRGACGPPGERGWREARGHGSTVRGDGLHPTEGTPPGRALRPNREQGPGLGPALPSHARPQVHPTPGLAPVSQPPSPESRPGEEGTQTGREGGGRGGGGHRIGNSTRESGKCAWFSQTLVLQRNLDRGRAAKDRLTRPVCPPRT